MLERFSLDPTELQPPQNWGIRLSLHGPSFGAKLANARFLMVDLCRACRSHAPHDMRVEELPQNALICVLLHLDFLSLLRAKAVCKRWLQTIAANEDFWKRKFEVDFGEAAGEEVNAEQEYRSEYLWRFKEPSTKILQEQGSAIRDVKVFGSLVASCSAQRQVKVWDLDKSECVWEFAETGSPFCIAVHNQTVFVGLKNGDIHSWDLASGELSESWEAHSDLVRDLCVLQDALVSGGEDELVKVWDLSTLQCLRVFGVQGFLCLHGDKEEVFCGSEFGEVSVFHKADGSAYTLKTIAPVQCVVTNSKFLFAGCGGAINVWDRETQEHLGTIGCMGGIVMGVWCNERRLVGASSEGPIRMWELKKQQCVKTISRVPDGGSCVDFDKDKVIVGGFTGFIHVLRCDP